MKNISSILIVLILFSFSAFTNTARGMSYQVDHDASVFAVILQKEGVAASLAHNHFIHASNYDATIAVEGQQPLMGTFSLSFKTQSLVADDPDVKHEWFPRIEVTEILTTPFPEIPEDDRKKISATMLSDAQLDAGRYPMIEAQLVKLDESPTVRGDVQFNYVATVDLTVHGQLVRKQLPAKIRFDNDILKVEAVGDYRFTEFGIKPFSAFFGAIKNKDKFNVYVNLTARPAE